MQTTNKQMKNNNKPNGLILQNVQINELSTSVSSNVWYLLNICIVEFVLSFLRVFPIQFITFFMFRCLIVLFFCCFFVFFCFGVPSLQLRAVLANFICLSYNCKEEKKAYFLLYARQWRLLLPIQFSMRLCRCLCIEWSLTWSTYTDWRQRERERECTLRDMDECTLQTSNNINLHFILWTISYIWNLLFVQNVGGPNIDDEKWLY